MSKNLAVSLVLVASLVMFVFGVCVADSAYAITEAQPESCAGSCVQADDGACNGDSGTCSGSVNGKSCDCHTFTNVTTGAISCPCNTGSNGRT